ncbi:multidrug resistance protein 1, 2, putative [Ricinus communis]|uniref:Multidrug resistance protein 1, 2, putative n=1 Tax=Ricinus communis TaxID=3988 RepID=B9S018_RICCO|nr:multidrug resistance protein 1, 2, putative [Ricinus communis]
MVNTQQAAASMPRSQAVDLQEALRKNGIQQDLHKSKKKDESTNILPYYKLFSFADSTDYLLMFVGAIASAGNGICMPLMTVVFGDVVNAFGDNSVNTSAVLHEVSKVSLKFVYLALGSGVAGSLQVACWMVTGERQAARIRSLYLKAILRQEIGFFDKETNTGETVARMSGDAVLIQDAMGEKVGKFLQLILTFISGFVIAFIRGWKLTLIMLSSIPPLVFSGALMAIYISKLASRGQTAYSLAATVVDQTIGSIRTVASFTGEKQAIARYNNCLTKACKSGVQESLAAGFGFGLVTFIVFSYYALVVWYGAKLVLNEGYKGGDIINIVFVVLTGSLSLGQASPCLTAFAAGQAAAFKMFEIIGRKPLIESCDTNGRTLDDIHGDIELKDICFSYPARPEEQILGGFSLYIPSGTTAALVGESGSGKSTVISLIERFYDPLAGEVLIDRINLKEFQLKWIRQKIGLVSQEPALLTCSIKENIAYGKEGASTEEVRAAAELANAAKFIDKLPQGFDTMVGEHGTQLSGGQKQRVALARAILKNPRILLLDEATSALDTESERIVQEALDKVMVNRTTVIIAHRLSTVRNADTISVIHRGKIVEQGCHSELTKDPDGAYSQLIRTQEIGRVSECSGLNELERPEITVDSGRHSSQHFSFLRTLSRGSSGIGNSSRHSFSVPIGLPLGMNVPDSSPAEPYPLASASLPPPSKIPLHRLAHLNRPEIPVLLLGSAAAAANGVVMPFFGVLVSSMIKTFFEPADKLQKDSRLWAFMFLGLASLSLLAYPLRSFFFAVAGCKLIKRIRSMCFEKVVYMEVSWFDKAEHSSGAIGAKLSANATSVSSLVGDTLGLLVQNIATAIAGLVIAFEANWQLACIILLLLPLLGLNGYLQMKFIEEKVMELYERKCQGPVKRGIREGLISGFGFGLSFLLLYSVYATSFYAGARLVEAGDTTYVEVFRVFCALTMAALGVSQTSSLAPDASKANRAAASVFAILDQKSKIDSSDDSGTVIEHLKGDIELRHVSFRYPTRPEIQIFRDLSLAIHAGKTVALVGESGSGKSTVISLLQRFYDPDSGCITLDGIEIQKLKLKWLRQQMGLVGQEPVLFNDSIRANIEYGKEGNATEAEIVAASVLANAHDFISGLQQGYDTRVGERGIQLSGGQKQRVAIARAIVKAPKILLLDEATSALDAESERVVQEAVDRAMVNRTTVVVAHRISTIRNADVIAVVKNGGIAEKGKHETLMNMKDGIYASIVALHTRDGVH